MSIQLLSGDSIYMRYTVNPLYYNSSNGWRFVAQNEITYMNVIKMSWASTNDSCNESNCGAINQVEIGTPIFYGDMVSFFIPSENKFLAVTDTSTTGSKYTIGILNGQTGTVISANDCPAASNGNIQKNFTFCAFYSNNQDLSRGCFIFVNKDGVGYLPPNNGQNWGPADYSNPYATKTPVYYNENLFIQSPFEQKCKQSQNGYLVAWTSDNGDGYIPAYCGTISNKFPNTGDDPGYVLTLGKSCDYTDVCNSTCTNSVPKGDPLVSGMYISIYSAYVGYIVYNNGDDTFAFDDTGTYKPGDTATKFVVKKLNNDMTGFVKSTDADAVIYPGEPVVFFGTTATEQGLGMVYTADTGSNNVVVKYSSQVYVSDNGCGNDGAFYATWVFVETDQSGSLGTGAIVTGSLQNNGSYGTVGDSPILLGSIYMVENFGKSQCFSSNGGNKVFWKADGDLLQTNTPNFNASSLKDVSDLYPTTPDWFFYVVNPSGGITCSGGSCPTNDCVNCPDSCDTSKGCCGCNTGWSFGKYLAEGLDWILDALKWIGIIILVIILIIVIIIVISLVAKSAKGSGDKKKKK